MYRLAVKCVIIALNDYTFGICFDVYHVALFQESSTQPPAPAHTGLHDFSGLQPISRRALQNTEIKNTAHYIVLMVREAIDLD